MKRTKALAVLFVTALSGSLLMGCSSQDATTTTSPPVVTPEATPVDYPLSEPGPYQVGVRPLATKDPTRSNRPVDITVWYPAVRQSADSKMEAAAADPSGPPTR